MALRLVNGKWKGGTKKDAAKLKSSKISSSSSNKKTYSSKKTYTDTSQGFPIERIVGQSQEQARAAQQKYASANDWGNEDKKKSDKKKSKSYAYGGSGTVTPTKVSSGASGSWDAPSNRSLAGGIFGTPTAGASGGSKPKATSTPTIFGRAIQVASDPLALFKGKKIDLGVTEALGINKWLRDNPETGGSFWDDSVVPVSNPSDYELSDSFSQPYETGYDPDADIRARNKANKESGEDLIRKGVDERTARQIASGAPNPYFSSGENRPSPTKTENQNTFYPETSNLSSIYSPQQDTPDYTPVTPENSTIQRLPGRGIFSTGFAGNGSGNYGVEGSFGGNAMDNEENLLNQILGVNTAQASEPQSLESQSFDPSLTQYLENFRNQNALNYMQANPYQSYIWGENTNYQDSGENEPRLSQGTGTAGYSQGSTGGQPNNPTYDYTQQLIKQQDKEAKAQKKAWKKLQKSIKKNYADLETEGKNQLNKQQFNDTLQVGGNFNLANADPNDEQRMQYQQRLKDEYAASLSDLLSKLSKQKKSALESGQANYESAMQQIADAKAAQKYKLAQLLYNAAKKGASGSYYGWGGNGIEDLENEYYNA